MSAVASVVLHDVTFCWPDGTPALADLSAAFGPGRTGLVGRNGAGKSTLLRLIRGELTPSSGRVTTSGVVVHLPQHLARAPGDTVADLLGVRNTVDAIRAVEAGRTDEDLFERIGDDWDIEERSLATLAANRLELSSLDRPTATLSGGETTLAAIVGVMVRGADVALLDEPTNNLDADGRDRVHALVRGWRGALIVASHDEALLELMDDTAELRSNKLAVFPGGFRAYRAQVAAEQNTALRALRTAEQTLKAEKRQRIQAEERIAHSERKGRTDAVNRRFVRAVVNNRRNSAQKAQAARRGLHDDRLDAARKAVDDAGSRVRDDDHISIQLPDPGVPAGRRIARLVGSDEREYIVQGPERIALTGPNGAGKTTLIRQLLSGAPAPDEPGAREERRRARASAHADIEHIGYLSQHLEGLDTTASALAHVQRVAAGIPTSDLRNQLARLLLRGGAADRPVATLSGGERFRAALARVLLADPPPQLLVLDEPTNNLDSPSVTQLVESLAAYRGALIVISHDRGFVERLEPDAELRLDHDGTLTRVG
ncbi:ABC-F family ATP-binding cassette domain-containing protein [Microbacterium sp.]|uniref:ABC-F family ATP-binding cassette domain-containing protein n=1 Tax=Microbacterium sp. TaxID=51671 RepID=UPI003A89C4D7